MKSSEIFKDDNSVQAFFDKVFSDQTDVARMQNERIIWRNIMYYIGEQYIEFLKSSGTFRRRQLPDYVPTPVSNEIREFVRSQKALLMNQQLVPRVWPNTNEREDKEASVVGQDLLISMDQADGGAFFDEKEKVCIWLCLSGTGFIRTFPDSNGGQWLVDQDGLVGKTGDVGVDCFTPFNVRCDSAGDKLSKKRWVGTMSLEDHEWVEDTFKVKIEMKGEDKTFLDYQKRLAKLVANVSPWKGHSLDYSTMNVEDEDVMLFREMEFRPTVKYPNGLYFISCGGQIIYKRNRLPIQSTPEEWNYTLTDFHYNYVPGRFWSDAAINDLISPQNTINQIDQAQAINRMGCARPTLFLPTGSGLKKVEGVHGMLYLEYNPMMGQKPTIESGTPLPQQVLEERRNAKEQIQDSGGDPKNILRGASPSAQSSGVQLDMMRETVERGKTPDIDRFNRALTRVYKKRLLLAQEIFTEERTIKTLGRDKKVKIQKFKAADLKGNTDIRLELDSGLITTKSGQAQVMLNMTQAGMFDETKIKPSVRQELLERFGMAGFSDEGNVDIDLAERENMMIAGGERQVIQIVEAGQDGKPQVLVEDPTFKYQNHPVHYEAHIKFIFSDEFRLLPDQLKTILIGHADTHRMEIDNVKPDMRQFVQIDKLYPLLTRSEQMQILSEIGVQPDPKGEVAGLPSANTAVQADQHLRDTEVREANKAEAIKTDRMKVMVGAATKMQEIKRSAQDKSGGANMKGK
jgi:hypothetical protein